jgi:S-layer family protein
MPPDTPDERQPMTITLTRTKLALAILTVALLVPTTALATHVFDDVPDDKFYAGPVDWAATNNITTGKSPTSFAPDDNVTRGEAVTFLKRYDDNIVQPAFDALLTPVAVAYLEPTGGTNVTVTGTVGLTATYNTSADKITVSLTGMSLSPTSSVVLVTPIRINSTSATEDRSVQTFFNSGSVEITVWDSSVGGPLISDVAITIYAL